MVKRRKKMHLAQFLTHGPSHHSLAMWRHPRSDQSVDAWRTPELYQHIAKVCERGLFDMVFFADLNYISDTYRGSLDPVLAGAAQAPEHDPIPLLSFMAAATDHIGLSSTFSTSHHHPFYVARLWATLDHLTRGRSGWNVVTSLNHNQADNFGEEREPTDVRYERAEEFIEVCLKLWDSWEPDAEVRDVAGARFADASKVHRIDHDGEFFRSRGPLNVVRSPYGGPAILQAGTSPKGRNFAARHADAIFAIQPGADDARLYYDDVKSRAVDHGRDPDHCQILYGAQPILGSSEAEALERQEEHNGLVPLDAGLALLSAHLDFDLSKLPLDALLSERPEPELARMATRFRRPDGTAMTVEEVGRRHGQSVGLPQMVGTPASVADQLEDYFDTVGGDGFMLSAVHCPGAIEEFVDLVVPELQRRGRFRTEYRGTTQRELLRQQD